MWNLTTKLNKVTDRKWDEKEIRLVVNRGGRGGREGRKAVNRYKFPVIRQGNTGMWCTMWRLQLALLCDVRKVKRVNLEFASQGDNFPFLFSLFFSFYCIIWEAGMLAEPTVVIVWNICKLNHKKALNKKVLVTMISSITEKHLNWDFYPIFHSLFHLFWFGFFLP